MTGSIDNKVCIQIRLYFEEFVLGQPQLFNHGSIHDAHDQTQSETIQQHRANLEVIISDPLNMSNQYSIGKVNF